MQNLKPKVIKILTSDSQEVSQYEKLKQGVLYLNSFGKSTELQDFFDESIEIMGILTQAFQGKHSQDLYLPWVKFLNVAHKVFSFFRGKSHQDFQTGMNDILQTLLLPQINQIQELDWRIARKIFAYQEIFHNIHLLIPEDFDLVSPIKYQLEEALDYLDWTKSQESLARGPIEVLLKIFNEQDQEAKEYLKKAIIAGRFDKKIFSRWGLQETIILGEDSGIYLLLNSVNESNRTFLERVVGQDFLQSRISEVGKVIINRFRLGKVRFALNLIKGVQKPNDLICVKKTGNHSQIYSQVILKSPIEHVTNEIFDDYLTNDLVEILYSPKILDMALVNEKSISDRHKKGYIMMELVPQNTGRTVFNPENGQITEYQKWEHQKPYLLDIFNSLVKLHEKGIALSSLDPIDTLYDKELRQATIIDTGGTIIQPKDLSNFHKREHRFKYKAGFASPELMSQQLFDIRKSIAYSCGKVTEIITTRTDYPNPQEIKDLIVGLTRPDPNERMTIETAIKCITKMGDEYSQEHIIFTQYVSKIKERILSNENLNFIGLNDDIEQTRKLLIPLEVTTLDPYKYSDLEHFPFKQAIEDFLTNSQKRVFLLLGVAGAGKSIALQLRFIEALENWKVGEPLPIYFNLANGIDLETALEKINKELKTNLSITKNLNGKPIHLYVDSFDEGFYSNQEKKENLISNYLATLGPENIKIFITSRSEYSVEFRWFSSKIEELDVCYLAPLNFENDEKLRSQILKFLENKTEQKDFKSATEEYFNKIKSSGVTMTTGFMFHLVMNTLPHFNDYTLLTKENIYKQYVINHQTEIQEQYTDKQKEKLSSFLLSDVLQILGQYLATELHSRRTFRINQENELFKQLLNYKPSREFKHQMAFYILQLLPLKIEVATSEKNRKQFETITIGFKHETIKNFYLGETIFKDEADLGILGTHNIAEDVELVRYLAEITKGNNSNEERLLNAVFETRTNKSKQAVTYAANAMTILVAAQFPFSGGDLRFISINGADLSNGLFHKTDFSEADLTDVAFRNAYLNEALFKETKVMNLELGIFPDLVGHKEAITSIQYSPDGKTLATASKDGTVKIWERVSGRELQTLIGHQGAVNCIAYSPDGKTIVSGSDDKTVQFWNVLSGQFQQIFKGQTGPVKSVAYSPDGETLAIGEDNTVRICNSLTGQPLNLLKGHSGSINCIAYSPQKDTLATASSDGTVKIWPLFSSQEELRTFRRHGGPINCVAYSPDGKTIVTASNGWTAIVWDLLSGEQLHPLEGHDGSIFSIAYNPDGKTIVTGSDDWTIKIWDARSGKELKTLSGHFGAVKSVAYSPGGEALATAAEDKTVKIWNTLSGKELQTLRGHDGSVNSVALSRDGNTIATVSDDKTVKIWEKSSGKEPKTLKGHTEPIKSVAFSFDGETLATTAEDRTVVLWNLLSGEILRTFGGKTKGGKSVADSDNTTLAPLSRGEVLPFEDIPLGKELRQSGSLNCIAYSPNGKTLAVASTEGTVKILDGKSGEELNTLRGHFLFVCSIVYSPDGNTLATASRDGTVKIWNLLSGGKEIQNLPGTFGSANCIAYSPDGKAIAIAGGDKTVRIWDPINDKDLRILEGHEESVLSIAYSPDEKTLVTASKDRTVKIWNIQSGKELQTLRGHFGSVNSVAYSQDGETITTVSDDWTAKIWDIRSGKELYTLSGHSGPVNCVTYSPDGKTIVTGSDDKNIKVWERTSGKELKTLKGHDEPVKSVAYSSNGTLATVAEDRTMKIWEPLSGKEPTTLRMHEGSAKSTTADSISRDETISIGQVIRGKELRDLSRLLGSFNCVVFSPDEKTLVTGADNETVQIWDIPTGKEIQALKGHTGSVKSITYSPDGETFATASEDETAKIWSAQSLSEQKTLCGQKGHKGPVTDVAYSPTQKTIATSSEDKTVKIWDYASGNLLQTLQGHSGPVKCVVYSPDGRTLASGSSDRTVIIWGAFAGKKLQVLQGHTDQVNSLVYTPDGKTLITVSADRAIKIWEVSSNEKLRARQANHWGVKSIPDTQSHKSNEFTFLLMRNITRTPTFHAHKVTIDEAIDLSERNRRVLKEFGDHSKAESLQQEEPSVRQQLFKLLEEELEIERQNWEKMERDSKQGGKI